MINAACFSKMKRDVLLVNTSRGDIVNERDLVAFLSENPQARVATDVLADEIRSRSESPLLQYAHRSEQVIITPHIGGMSREAQEIAYGHAARRLQNFFAVRTMLEDNREGAKNAKMRKEKTFKP
jgi:D-3-phosphoglycerate dehydrogenase